MTTGLAEWTEPGPGTQSLRDWAADWLINTGVRLLDPDGFDRRDEQMWERHYTKEEFERGLARSTCQWTTTGVISTKAGGQG